MRLRRHTHVLPICLIILIALLARGAEKPPVVETAATPAVNFDKDIQPVFAAHCIQCHGAEKQKSDYRLDQMESALKGGSIGGAIVPGDSGKSALIQYVAGTHHEIVMPPKGAKLSAQQFAVLRAWIDQGAKWDAPAVIAATQPAHWALLPLNKPQVPVVKDKTWGRTPIDAFVLAKLEEKGMRPSAEAGRRALMRRVMIDLTGLPPAPAEVEAFVADQSPDAYEKVVDRLLASPRHGERWARHWMDVVHYAETHGHDEDKPRPNAWPYRDYLITSFNGDKPYARFVREQLAGDVLWPDDPQAIIATAFNAVGPWDQSSQMGILDGTVDKQAARYLDRDDMLMTAMSTFSSSTVHCARCHNHKFDPISQADYYALQAVFAGVDRVDRPYDADPKTSAERKRLLAEKAALDAGAVTMTAGVRARVGVWEQSHRAVNWMVIDPSQLTSTGGATLTMLADGSILSGGVLPDQETVKISAKTSLKRVTAVRLEVLVDSGLPHGGPGRQPENGNLHLSEFKMRIGGKPVMIGNASADFDQEGWMISRALDDDSSTAWGIHPQEGQSHVAIFELKTPTFVEAGALLEFTLEQLHGRGHVIGRMRISVTDAPLPVRVELLADGLAEMLAVPVEKRSEAQRAELARRVLKLDVNERLAKLPPAQMLYGIASDFAEQANFKPAKKPRLVEVLRRGDVRQPIAPAAPGALSCVSGLEARFKLADAGDEGARRAALADWLVAPQNVLTWRSIVNRIWHHHFGRGIVETPNDFGRMGASPTHPELLDWLAVTFRDGGGSMKQLHKMIVMSSVYRQASGGDAKWSALDGENRLLWRMNRTRLDAEAVRDCILSISGKLDLTMGGPSVKQFIETKGVHVTPNVDYGAFDVESAGSMRRSVYRFVFRTVPDPFMQTLDCPDASQLAPKRESSVTALQALVMLNDRFVIRQSAHVADRLMKAEVDLSRQVGGLYQLVLGRPPVDEERQAVMKYAAKHGLANAARMLLNSNEFMFVE